ncbi:unnamed protein product [Adineta steineri]|uniref:EGF-like domain-containing protein n=1 Tax=Adineta steineri TaxID=433720 RepID=A0A815SBB6_9BILA|nr:unnamed protein product [Adineta steineri]CAF1640473.1 unnamed protein product [Adineta steineri]
MRDTDDPAPPPCTVALCCGKDSFAPCDDNGATNYCHSDTIDGVQMYGYIDPDYGMITSRYECPIDNCPCLNGGTCGPYNICQCKGEWTGETCSECLCENGGTCTGPDGTCECTGGWTGETCTTSSPCSAALCCGTDTCIACTNNGTASYCHGRDLNYDYSIYTFGGDIYTYDGILNTNGNVRDPDNYIHVGPSPGNLLYAVYLCPYRCADGTGFATHVGTC